MSRPNYHCLPAWASHLPPPSYFCSMTTTVMTRKFGGHEEWTHSAVTFWLAMGTCSPGMVGVKWAAHGISGHVEAVGKLS